MHDRIAGDRLRARSLETITRDSVDSAVPGRVRPITTVAPALEGARRVVRAAEGAASRVERLGADLAARVDLLGGRELTTTDELECRRAIFEIESCLRRAETDLARVERVSPASAAAVADDLANARAALATAATSVAPIVSAAARCLDGERAAWSGPAQTMSARLGLPAIEVRTDAAAPAITEAHGARGVALGDAVHLHPARVSAGTDDGREVLAHELIHLAQARLPPDRGHGRAAAEHEATILAPVLATGGLVPAVQHSIDLSRPAGDGDAAILPD